MVRATLVEGVGKRWLELEKYVWTKDGWRWRTVGRAGFGDIPEVEERIEEAFSLLNTRLDLWLGDSFSEDPQGWLSI